MTRVVHKLTVKSGDLDVRGHVRVALTGFKRWLRVGVQENNIVIWFERDPDDEQEVLMALLIAGTGREYDDRERGEYLGTAENLAGALVFHVFEAPLAVFG